VKDHIVWYCKEVRAQQFKIYRIWNNQKIRKYEAFHWFNDRQV